MLGNLHEKQTYCARSPATEILYGGAAGGGKSHLLRTIAIQWCREIPGLQVYLFRRTSVDLRLNHLQGPTSILAMIAPLVKRGECSFNKQEKTIRFHQDGKPDSIINLCHCQYEDDVYNYQGPEIHVLLMDELTHFTEFIYRYLRGRTRKVKLPIPAKYEGMFPRIICGSNPGNIGHSWVKATFVDYQPPLVIQRTPKTEGKMLRQYIPAIMDDNPALMKEDPDYADRLEGLGSPELVKAMRYGLWDITAGAALEKLRRDVHMIRPFRVPDFWTKFTVIDWGTFRPYSVGWYCVAGDDTMLAAKDGHKPVCIPKNAIIRYKELYGYTGKANEGTREESPVVAKRIIEIEDEAGEEMDFRIGDSGMWNQVDGPSVAKRMYEATNGIYSMGKSKKDRIQNYQEIRARLVGNDGIPMLYITENCTQFWRTVPDLQIDEKHPEKGPDTTQEDHIYDDLSYACAANPMGINETERYKMDYDRARRRVDKNPRAGY